MTEKGREKGIFPYPQRAGKGLIYSPVVRAVTREEEWLKACHSPSRVTVTQTDVRIEVRSQKSEACAGWSMRTERCTRHKQKC